MKNTQQTGSAQIIAIVIIVIIIFVVGISFYKSVQLRKTENIQSAINTQSATDDNRQVMDKEIMIGTWYVGGTDAGDVRIYLSKDKTFTLAETYSNIDFDTRMSSEYIPKNGDWVTSTSTGAWNVGDDASGKYLSFIFDTDIEYVPTDPAEIANFKKYGQEFFGKREVRLRPEYYAKEPTLHFRYFGFLMDKLI